MKKRAYLKLACTASALLAAMAMIVMSSYAWLTASSSPVAEGIQVAVGGGSTILLAQDVKDDNGNHYPGVFGKTLTLSDILDPEAYMGLLPVSTADGIHWYLPTYYTDADPEVLNGEAVAGTLKPCEQFTPDETLAYANLSPEAEEAEDATGHYLYADFWVVSPGGSYDLRVSTSTKPEDSSAGSYVIDLPQVVENKDGKFELAAPENPASESLRIGFLVNRNFAGESQAAYAASNTKEDRYTGTLLGVYQEKGSSSSTRDSEYNFFHIYEPNGTGHSQLGEAANGSYLITFPLGVEDGTGTVKVMPVGDQVSVQTTSTWSGTAGDMLEAAVKMAGENPTAAQVQEKFYGCLQNNLSTYVNKGKFVSHTSGLYTKAVDASVSSNAIDESALGGANEDNSGVIVRLEKNQPQRIRMFIWVEGQDADCVSGVTAGSFAVRIELSGSSVNK